MWVVICRFHNLHGSITSDSSLLWIRRPVVETDQPPIAEQPAKRRWPIVTVLSCVACVIVFLGLLSADKESWESVSRWGYYPSYDIWAGAYWAFITTAFVHFDLWHVAINVYWLYILGAPIERRIGPVQYGVLFLAAGLFSSLAEFVFAGDTGIGASGVAYGLFGYMWVKRREVPEFAQILTDRLVLWFLIWLIACVGATLTNIANVGNAAHISGLLFGVAIASRTVFVRWKHFIHAGLAAAIVALVIPLFWAPWSFEWTSHKAIQAHEAGDIPAAIGWYKRSMELGQDKAWCLANMARLHAWNAATENYKQALEELRKIDPDKAAEIEKETARTNATSEIEVLKEK